MSGGVFICYRREETAFAARAIHDRVVQRLERDNVSSTSTTSTLALTGSMS